MHVQGTRYFHYSPQDTDRDFDDRVYSTVPHIKFCMRKPETV